VNGTAAWRQIGFVGDPPEEPQIGLFSDADFADCKATQKSTSGVFLAVYGPHSFCPLAAQSKKRTAVSNITVEAEVAAAAHAFRMYGLLCLPLWEKLL
jgi:hypothetical protein